MKRSSERGVTFIEMMVVLGIFVVLGAALMAGLGAFSGRSVRADLKDATLEILDFVEFARTRAAMDNQAYQIIVNPTADPQLVTVLVHPANNCLTPGTVERVVRFTSTSAGVAGASDARWAEVTITNLQPTGLPGLCFRPDGRVELPMGGPVPPAGGTNLLAGQARISLRMRAEQFSPAAVEHQVIIPYNGIARVEYIVP